MIHILFRTGSKSFTCSSRPTKQNQNPIQNGIEILGSTTQYSFTFAITRNKIKSQHFWIALDKFLSLKQKWQDDALWRTKILP